MSVVRRVYITGKLVDCIMRYNHVSKVLTIKWKHSLRLLISDRTKTFSRLTVIVSHIYTNEIYPTVKRLVKLIWKKFISINFLLLNFFVSLWGRQTGLIYFFYKFTGSRHYRRGLFESSTTSCFASVSPGECTGTPSRECHRETCIVDTKSCTDLGNLYATVD